MIVLSLVELTRTAGLDGVVMGATGMLSLTRFGAWFASYAKRRGCTTRDLAGSLGRRLAAFVLRRGRGRHRMWRNYALQREIRSDWRTLKRWG